jgi:ABC-type multidrug transport system ATPase subunit
MNQPPGLDPAVEFRLMESLRHLAATGCTILCTTHVLDHAFLFDRLAVMFGGRLVFFGEPADALKYFGVERLTLLYDALSNQPELNWPPHPDSPLVPSATAVLPRKHRRSSALPILLLRQWGHLPTRLEKSAACSWPAGLHRFARQMGE